MITKTYGITLDVLKGIVESPAVLVAGDTGNRFEIEVVRNGAALDLSGADVKVCMRGAHTASIQDGDSGVTVSGNKVTVQVYPECVSTGTNSCDVQIYTESDTLITTAAFTFEVRAATVGDDTVIGSPSIPVLLSLIAEVYAAKEGFPSISVSDIPGGHRLTVMNVESTVTCDVMDGVSGVYVGGGSMPEGFNVQIDPDGTAEAYIQEPAAEGTSGQVLATDGSGTRYWKTVSGGGGGGTSDYTELENKPQINGVTLSGNKSTADLSLNCVYLAVYGTTTSAELEAAYQAGKEIICIRSGAVYRLVKRESATLHFFAYEWASANQMSRAPIAYYMKCSSNSWNLNNVSTSPACTGTGMVKCTSAITGALEPAVPGTDYAAAAHTHAEKLDASAVTHETWTFTLEDDSTVTKEVVLWQ